MRMLLVLWLLVAAPSVAHSATYYISPTGSNAADGMTTTTPWLTFAYAINSSRAWCGDTLVLLNGTYGDGTSTGKVTISGMTCTQGDEFTVIAQNQRKAKIFDNGTGTAFNISNSSYIVVDGMYLRSQDNASGTLGRLFRANDSHHITVKNGVYVNPNRYVNTHPITFATSQDILVEDNEMYIFHRHCVSSGASERMVVRRAYCNPRGGKIPGGFSAGGQPLGSGDTAFTMYPCKDCILENAIADGTTNSVLIGEMNANFASGVVSSGNKILGSIAYNATAGNGVYLNPRSVSDLNHAVQDALIKDVAMIEYNSASAGIKCTDCVNVTIDHVTVTGVGGGAQESGYQGILANNSSTAGVPSSQASMFMTNILTSGIRTAASIAGHDTWSGDVIVNHSNTSGLSPTPPSNWTNVVTTNPAFGTCKGLWLPDASPLKGTGTGGSDPGATILYRYVDGVLTTTPLWDPTTGAFPHGEADLDNVNRVAGQSLYDVHTRLNVNTGGCAFPAGYASGGTPTNPATVVSSTDLTGPHVHEINSDSLIVGFAAWHAGQNVGTASAITSSCGGEDIPALPDVNDDTSAKYTSPPYRSLRLFGKVAPTPGTCTITPTITGNIDGWVMVSIERENVGSFGRYSSATGLSGTPSVTVTEAEQDHTIIDFLATNTTTLVTAGPAQSPLKDQPHSTQAIRIYSTEQAGSSGQIMSETLSTAPYWRLSAIPLIPGSPDPPSGSTVTLTNYRAYFGYGTHASAEQITKDANQAAPIGPVSVVRLRVELTDSVAASAAFGVVPYCRTGAGAYTRVMDGFNGLEVRYFGAGVEGLMPASASTTPLKLGAGPYSAFSRDENSIPLIPGLAVGEKAEVEWAFVIESAVDSTVQCLAYRDDGTPIAASVTPTFTIQANVAAAP